MPTSSLSILWICGPPGVGKTTAGWRLFQRERAAATAFVDIDQLGLRFPWPDDDADNHGVKLAVLDALVALFERQGVRRLIVSGVLLPDLATRVGEVTPGRLRICRLTSDLDSLVERYLGRDPGADDLPQLRQMVERVEELHADDVIDTTGLDADEVAARIARIDESWRPGPSPRPASVESALPLHPLPGLLLHGPRAVGTSTAGFTAMLELAKTVPVAFLDLGQYAFIRPTPPLDELSAIRRAAIATAAAAFHREGARAFVLVGHPASAGGIAALRDAVPWIDLMEGRLTADRDSLAERLRLRVADRGSAHLAGDDLRGLATDAADAVLRAAVADAADAAEDADFVLDTAGQSVSETSDAVLRASGLIAP